MSNIQVADAQYIDVVMSVFNLTGYIDNCSKILGLLWQYWRDEPAINDNVEIVDFKDDNQRISQTILSSNSKNKEL